MQNAHNPQDAAFPNHESPITNHGHQRIALVAGEASGDLLGAGLIEQLRLRFPDAEFAGIGGDAMRTAGLDAWHDASELAVMGLSEVLKHLPRLLSLRARLRKRLLAWKPDVFVGIDAPEYDQICQRNGADYACGRDARKALAGLVAGSAVSCEGWETDRFGRLLAVCKAGQVDLNRRQVEEGWAVAYGDYFDAERTARDAKRGLWAGTSDRPRHWRDRHGGLAESEHDLFGAAMNWLRQLLGVS